jgi:hypothetical protein
MLKQIPIDMMNASALAQAVAATMGLDVRPNMGVAGIKAKMAQAGFPTDVIEIDDGRDEPEIKRVEPKRERHTPGRRMVQIRIEPQEKPGGNEPVFTSVNGSPILIPRAKTCWVDYKYYHALQNAVAHIAEVDQDSNITGYRKVPEYPVSVFHIEPKLSLAEKKQAEEVEAARLAALAVEREDGEDEDEAA